jgi:hypothetical protein
VIGRDFAREIAAAAKANDSETLLAIAIELAGENQELRALAARDVDRRQRQAERKKRSRSREVTGQSVTERDVTESHTPERDTAGQAVTSPLPVPSSSFPAPHLTTPLTPLPSAPPPPARAREAEPEKPHAALEARLAERLVSDADRNALTALVARVPSPTTWLAEMLASLEGMAGHELVTPEQLGQALRDYSGNGAMVNPGLKHFRTYLRRASQPAPAHAPGDDFDTAVAKHTSRGDRASLEAEAAEILATIRGLIRSHDLHGQGRKDYLPKSEVEKLGPRALKAYESVGGADRVLSAAGDDISYLIRDFTKAYVHASPTPALVGGAA